MSDAAVSAEPGVDAALAEFAAARWPALLRFGLLLTGNAADAEDLVQTALARTAARWRTMRSLDRPEAYVRTAMVRLCANRWRSLLSRERLTADVPERAAVADPIEDIADREAMWAALRTLPPRQRAVVVLRYYEDMSEREIARLLGITQGTVKSQASKALRTLRSALDLPDGAAGAAAGAAAGGATGGEAAPGGAVAGRLRAVGAVAGDGASGRIAGGRGAGGRAAAGRAALAVGSPASAESDIGADTAGTGLAGARTHGEAGDPGRSAGAGATATDLGAESTPAIGRMP